MTKRSSSNPKVVPLGRGPGGAASKADKLHLAQLKIYDAWEVSGRARQKLAKEALLISPDCADAYLVLSDGVKRVKARIELFKNAIAAGERALGQNWESKYKGVCWGTLETRPIMRAMSRLALALEEQGDLTEALVLFRRLMQINPGDNQGIRYLLANCLYEAGSEYGDEFEKLLAAHADDTSAAFTYTAALHSFRKQGVSRQSTRALSEAFESNIFVPIFFSGIAQMPNESPSSVGFGDETEAIAYVMDHGFLWDETDGAIEWMVEELAPKMRKLFEDQELVEDAIDALKGN